MAGYVLTRSGDFSGTMDVRADAVRVKRFLLQKASLEIAAV